MKSDNAKFYVRCQYSAFKDDDEFSGEFAFVGDDSMLENGNLSHGKLNQAAVQQINNRVLSKTPGSSIRDIVFLSTIWPDPDYNGAYLKEYDYKIPDDTSGSPPSLSGDVLDALGKSAVSKSNRQDAYRRSHPLIPPAGMDPEAMLDLFPVPPAAKIPRLRYCHLSLSTTFSSLCFLARARMSPSDLPVRLLMKLRIFTAPTLAVPLLLTASLSCWNISRKLARSEVPLGQTPSLRIS